MRNLPSATAIVAVIVAVAGGPASAEQFINILNGGTSGVYYPLGVALSNIYAKAIPDTKSSVQATKASVENLNLLQAGRGEIAFALGDTVSLAWAGNADAGFPAKLANCAGSRGSIPTTFRSLPAPIPASAHRPWRRGPAVQGFQQGRVPGLRRVGRSYEEPAVDTALQSAGPGVSSIRDLANSVPIVIAPIPAEVVRKMGGTVPWHDWVLAIMAFALGLDVVILLVFEAARRIMG